VTTECFLEVFKTMPELHRYIARQAQRYSCVRENQEDCIQEAWLAISYAPGDLSEANYKRIVHAAIYSQYWQEYKWRLLGRYSNGRQTPVRTVSDEIHYR